ncbi:hypothetical protein ACI6PS_06010 [Flavobacterium sp. PLA-1-15]|uniref:hypothetical protein n=1 Tax=Flavobacterium sp. PLA-1-15 TaxID=3380533 RepID=UPI003B7F97BD
MTDRVQINNRFIACINYLVAELKTESKGSIAQKMQITPSKFSEILHNRMSIGIEDLAVFAMNFDVDVNWILTGRGQMFLKTPPHIIKEPKQDYPQSEAEKDLIQVLKDQLEDLRKDKERLHGLLDTKLGKDNKM